MDSVQPNTSILSPSERRKRNRDEMAATILGAALAVMEEQGVSALNMNEVARRVKMRPQSLSEYFPNKNAVYDALVAQAFPGLRGADEAARRDHPTGLGRIQAWFENRIEWSEANPVIYHLIFDAPAPGWERGPDVFDMVRQTLEWTREFVAEAIADGVIDSGVSVEQTTDLLLSIRRGLIAERLGKRDLAAADRFDGLVPLVMQMIATTWAANVAPLESHRDAGSSGGDASA